MYVYISAYIHILYMNVFTCICIIMLYIYIYRYIDIYTYILTHPMFHLNAATNFLVLLQALVYRHYSIVFG